MQAHADPSGSMSKCSALKVEVKGGRVPKSDTDTEASLQRPQRAMLD